MTNRFLLCLFMLITEPLLAAIIYVDVANVTGPADGTQARPFNTIQEGIDNAGDGDTILVNDGIYRGVGNVNLVLEKNVTLKSVNGADATVIDCQGILVTGVLLKQSAVVKGFTIRYGDIGIATDISSEVPSPEIINCVISGNRTSGIKGRSSIFGCIIEENRRGIDEASGSVTNCIIRRNGSPQFGGKGGGIKGQRILAITNCIIAQNINNENIGGGGITCATGSDIDIINSTIVENVARSGGGIYCDLSSNTVVKNTVLWGNTASLAGNQVYLRNVERNGDTPDPSGGPSLSITFTNVQGGREQLHTGGPISSLGDAFFEWTPPPNSTYRNNINADPLFVDVTNEDYRLLPSSPCIDAGTLEGVSDTDIEGNKRPLGDFVDIGAYESVYGGLAQISFLTQPPEQMTVGEAFPFLPLGTDDIGGIAELPSQAVNWEVIGGIGTVDNVGLFIATTVGTGTVKATLISNPAITAQSIQINVSEASDLYQFDVALSAGVNIVSLPLRPESPITASSLIEDLDATLVVRSIDGRFQVYVPVEGFGTDFLLEGGQGYIVNLRGPTHYNLVGHPWGTPIQAAPSSPITETWAFAVVGRINGSIPINASMRVMNERTGSTRIAPISKSGKFTAMFLDMSRQTVLAAGDDIITQLIDADGEPLTKAKVTPISPKQVSQAYLKIEFLPTPNRNQLLQNYPNPFNPETWLPYQLAHDANVQMTIYDVNGKVVRHLNLGHQIAGYHTNREQAAYWDGRSEVGELVSSGLYFYRLQAGHYHSTRRMVILK